MCNTVYLRSGGFQIRRNNGKEQHKRDMPERVFCKTLPLVFLDKFVDYVIVPEQVEACIFIMEPPAGIALVGQIKSF